MVTQRYSLISLIVFPGKPQQILSLLQLFTQNRIRYVASKAPPQNWMDVFRQLKMFIRASKDPIQLTMITTYGLERNKYAGHVQSVVISEDLFQQARI